LVEESYKISFWSVEVGRKVCANAPLPIINRERFSMQQMRSESKKLFFASANPTKVLKL